MMVKYVDAFVKSTKNRRSSLLHLSNFFSIICVIGNILSIHEPPALNPDCSFLIMPFTFLYSSYSLYEDENSRLLKSIPLIKIKLVAMTEIKIFLLPSFNQRYLNFGSTHICKSQFLLHYIFWNTA